MYSMVLMAALTTGAATPDFGYWFGWDGYGLGWGGYGLGWGGWGGNGLGWGGWGGNGLGWGGWGYGYGGYPLGAYAYSPMYSSWGWGTPFTSGGGYFTPGMNQSFYYNPAASMPPRANPANEARLVIHLPPQAKLTIDDYPTMSRSDTRVFNTPPLEPGKTYTYTLRAEINRDGRFVRETKTVEVKAGELTEVTLRFGDVSREELGSPTPKEAPSRR
jgi:uncharacterized protein (TIGR03000 family)